MFLLTSAIFCLFQICMNIKEKDWVKKYHPVHHSCYAYSDSEWVGFDDEKSIIEKVSGS